MATYYSILAWEIPWTEAPGQLQSMGLQRVGHSGELTHTQMEVGHCKVIHPHCLHAE